MTTPPRQLARPVIHVARCPLHWPLGVPRTAAKDRKFLGDHWDDRVCFERVTGTLFRRAQAGGAENVILSTNQPLRYGLPIEPAGRLDDPGAALYFQHDGKELVFAYDRYLDLIDNIYLISSEMKKLSYRWREGDSQFVDCSYQVVDALQVDVEWWKAVLELDAEKTVDLEMCVSAYRRLSKRFHPDQPGGSHSEMQRLNAAMDEARELLQ